MERKSTESSNRADRPHRLRILRAGSEAELAREMDQIGVDPGGVALMSPKGVHRAVRLEDLSPWQANLLKQEMLSLGGEVAVHRGAIDCTARRSDALLMGSRKHFHQLLAKLEAQPPTMRRLGEEIRECLERYDRRRFILALGSRRLPVGDRTLVMGIVNASPDSFYDGCRYFSAPEAVEHGLRLAAEGADFLDVGGESTRPGAEPVSMEEEKRRVLPVIEALASRCDVPISVDTYKAGVAQDALAAGAVMVNDVSGLRGDPEMAGAVSSARAALVVMHMQGDPRTMQINPQYANLMGDIVAHLDDSMALAAAAGIDREQIVVDPGIGFGKRLEHNLHLIRHLSELKVLGRPILVGPSRKSFVGAVSDLPPDQRLEGTLAAVCLAVEAGAAIVRVHDVQAVRRTLDVADAVCRSGA